MDYLSVISYGSFVLNAIIFVVVLLLNKEALLRLRNVLDILTNGAYRNCPYFDMHFQNVLKDRAELKKKGGEDL